MDRKKLGRLRRELKQLRAAKYNLKTKKLTQFAKKIGRKRDPLRGKEPTYVSVPFPELNPLAIPGHKTVNPFTGDSIMDTFEADLDKWEDHLDEQDAKKPTVPKETKTHDQRQQLPAKTVREDGDSSGTEGFPRTGS